MKNPFRYFVRLPEITRRTLMLCILYPLPLCQVEDVLLERGIVMCHQTARL